MQWQDPVLFGGTVQYNLDPLQQYDDHSIWEALEYVSQITYKYDRDYSWVDF